MDARARPDAGEHAAAMALEGAHLFDPGGNNRPFKEWVVVPEAHASDWSRLAGQALESRRIT